ncbi:MAG: nucleotidyltransferase family protein, partial [Bacteroidales bacterium]|nr:nucleotidyltransferase family protein [Bacteroidales bacterium]
IQPLPVGTEERALLMLGGLNPHAGATEALAGVERMERFIWLANEHGVAAFVKKNIDEAGLVRLLLLSDYQTLRNQSFRSVARNSFIMTATFDAVRLLNEAGFTPVLLKGTALELTVYNNGGLRPMTDADILLPAAECLPAWKLLQGSGFEALPLKSPLHRLILMHTGKHLPSLIKGGFSIEIHHSLWGGKTGMEEELVQRSALRVQRSGDNNSISAEVVEKFSDGSAPANSAATNDSIFVSPEGMNNHSDGSTPSKSAATTDSIFLSPEGINNHSTGALPQDSSAESESGQAPGSVRFLIPPPGLHFLYLVAHLAKHELDSHSQLRLYNDLSAMLLHYGPGKLIGEAMERAPSIGMVEELRNKLGLLHKYMGVDLPVEYRFEPSAEAESSFLFFLSSPKANKPLNKEKMYRMTLSSIPGIHRKLIFLAGDIFPGFRFMKKRYGKASALSVLPYYFIRPGKLLWLLRKRD